MVDPRIAADGRDDDADDRDDTADDRDDTADGRDGDATQRDTDAAARDDTARRDSDDLDENVRRLCEQVLDHLSRIENAALDLDDWPELTPAALARLDAHLAEQRRLAGLARYGVTTLTNELRRSLTGLRHDRRAAARDRTDAAGDRRDAAGDRQDSGHDRHAAHGDRNQSAIERHQVDPRDLPPPPEQEQLNSQTSDAIATSRQRIADSHHILDATRDTLDDIHRRWARPLSDSERSPEQDQ